MTINQASAELFDPTGLTSLGALTSARNIQWQDILSQKGSATFEVPLDDSLTSSITDRCVVKFSLYGSVRFACRITSEVVQLAVDGRRWLRFESQPGLLQLLDDAVVLPELGLTSSSAASRLFGFMSVDGAWRITANWQAPLGSAWSTDIYRPKYPPDMATENPDWIAFDDPEDPTVPHNTYNYFRYEFTVAGTDYENFQFTFTADNFLTLYMDGEEIISPDPTHPFGWQTSTTVTAQLAPGDHVLAAKVLNGGPGAPVPGPMGLIGFVFNLDSATGLTTTELVQTDTVNWIVAKTPMPGWTRAQVLKQLVTEAQTRGSLGPSLLTINFTDTEDTDSVSWADAPDQYEFSVTTTGLADVASQLAESAIDVAVDPVTMELNCWVRKGSDLSGSVALTLGDAGGNLKSHETTKTVTRFTDVYTQLADGSWQVTTDSAGVTAVGGHVEVGLSVSTSADDTATNLALVQLAESAQPLIAATSQPSSLIGAQGYIDYDVGDTITVPAHRNAGTMKARVLAVTVDATGDVISVWPQFVLDGSV